jgi:diacylglycerol O-acyltransferase
LFRYFDHPMWRENCGVDFNYQRSWKLAAPGGRRELDEAIGQIASTPLDRAHPLWEMYFVEGLANDRIAVVVKIHHALADGVASANLMAHGMDLMPTPQRASYTPDPAPGTRRLMASAFVDDMRTSRGSPRRSGTPRRAWAGCGAARASCHRN